MTTNVAIFALAAFFEIAGCFAFWMWLRRGATPLVVLLGIASLICFAVALTRVRGKGVRGVRWNLHRRIAGVAVGSRGSAANSH